MNYQSYNDYELLYMARDNDDYSKNILYKKYLPILNSISNEFYSNYKDFGYEYDDFLQEANICFMKAIDKYNDNKNCLFYSFVVLCVRRGLITFCRNISTEKNLVYIYSDEIDETTVTDSSDNVEYICDNNEFLNYINKIIINSSIEISSVLELRINGFNYREIGKLLDLPTSTVEYRIRKIKNEFSKAYCKKAF